MDENYTSRNNVIGCAVIVIGAVAALFTIGNCLITSDCYNSCEKIKDNSSAYIECVKACK